MCLRASGDALSIVPPALLLRDAYRNLTLLDWPLPLALLAVIPAQAERSAQKNAVFLMKIWR
jgi:hypothetical protein